MILCVKENWWDELFMKTHREEKDRNLRRGPLFCRKSRFCTTTVLFSYGRDTRSGDCQQITTSTTNDNESYWLLANKVISQRYNRQQLSPGRVPPRKRPKPQIETVSQLIHHLRTTDIPKAKRGPPRCHELFKLQKNLSEMLL